MVLAPPLDPRSIRSAVREFVSIGARADQWSTLAWADVKLRYRRTTLGPAWITLGLGATVFSVGILFGVLFGNALSDYLPYFAAGIIAWTFFATCLTDGCAVFTGAAATIKAIPVPLVVHVYRMMARQVIMLGHNMALIVLLWLIFQWRLDWSVLLFLAGVLLDSAAAFGLVLALGTVGARFRDVQLIVSTVLQLMFLLTPVIWQPSGLRGASLTVVADLNPLYHLVEVLRRPLLGAAPEPINWVFAGATAALSLAIGVHVYARYRHRVAFWV